MAAASKQAQLRSLMKQKQSRPSDTPATTARVVHKLAHYTAKGDLVCLLCKAPVKSSALWSSHCSSSSHKQKLEILANQQRQQNTLKETSLPNDHEANEPSAKRPKLSEPTASETHHTMGPTSDNDASYVPLPPEDDGPSNEQNLKALRAEWDEQEAMILKSEKMEQSATEEAYPETLPEEDNESEDDLDEYMGQSTEDDMIMAKHAEHRLSLLQGQKESMLQSDPDEEEKSGESESDEDSESSEEVDVNDLYNWRSRAL